MEAKFNRGHFPAGTRVVIDTGMKPAFEANVIAVESNGYDSWIVLLDQPCEIKGRHDAYHISFVKKIIKRGEGKENTFYYDVCPRKPESHFYDGKSPNKYVGFLHSLVSWKVSQLTFNTSRDHQYDMDKIVAQLQHLCTGPYGSVCVNKKKFNRLVKQAMAQAKINRRKAQREYDEEINKAFYEDADYGTEDGFALPA